jgi:hypothetical protein
MLRSLGIPSRIAVGFMTVERSHKNKGWYWYYADQAHAWVQVYFPGLGWLDFDTTVGNDEAQDSPKPDGTPPMQPPRAWLAAEGTAANIDTTKKLMTMQVKSFVYHDKEYKLPQNITANMDVHIAQVRRDSVEVPLASIEKGEAVTVVSYADAFKNMQAGSNESGTSLMKRFPDPEPIDEVYLKRKDNYIKEAAPKPAAKPEVTSFNKLLLQGVAIITGLILLFLLWPTLLLEYYKLRTRYAKPAGQKAYWSYRTAAYYLNQLGYSRGRHTPMKYAREVIDPALGTSFTSFMNVYLKEKYAKQPLNEREQQFVVSFLAAFFKTIKQKVQWRIRFARFLNPMRASSFFVRPADEEAES